MRKKSVSLDEDLAKAGVALRRAAVKARQLAEQTGTPLYVLQGGRVVNLNVPPSSAYIVRESGKTH
jgi:hypothetical protein